MLESKFKETIFEPTDGFLDYIVFLFRDFTAKFWFLSPKGLNLVKVENFCHGTCIGQDAKFKPFHKFFIVYTILLFLVNVYLGQ